MGYPELVNWAGIKKADDGGYVIRDYINYKQRRVDPELAWFAKQLNGKRDPYKIAPSIPQDKVTEYLGYLDNAELLRWGRALHKSLLGLMITVWRPKVTENLRIVSWFINALLMVSWLPVLVFGIYGLTKCDIFDDSSAIAGGIFGTLIGIIMHELGHMFAALAYGGRVFELGVMLNFISPGAYTMIDEKPIKKRLRRMQMYAAGVEFNLLVAGVAGILAMLLDNCAMFFMFFSSVNIFLALGNICFSDGIDGFRILEELLGTENLFEKAKRVRKSKALRSHLMRKGLTGAAAVAACYMLAVFRLFIPLSFIVGVVGGFTWNF